MAKRLQVVLHQDVRKLGRTDDLVDVAPGYARNYLVPQGLASIATDSALKEREHRQAKERQRQLEAKREAEAAKTALETVGRFPIQKQVGEGKAIFGTVTAQEVADTISETTGHTIDRRGISLPEDINQTGFYQAEVKLHPEVTAQVQIQVVPS